MCSVVTIAFNCYTFVVLTAVIFSLFRGVGGLFRTLEGCISRSFALRFLRRCTFPSLVRIYASASLTQR